jgi:transcriptional regulator with XRE-family HTH domain
LEQEISNAFGTVLRKLRKKARVTQEQLALEAGLQRNYISSLELGTKQPSLLTIFKISTALGVKPEELIAKVSSELDSRAA